MVTYKNMLWVVGKLVDGKLSFWNGQLFEEEADALIVQANLPETDGYKAYRCDIELPDFSIRPPKDGLRKARKNG